MTDAFEAKLDSVNELVKQINRKLEDAQATMDDAGKCSGDIMKERFNEFFDRVADLIFDINRSVEQWVEENTDGGFDNEHNGATLDNSPDW